MSVEYRFEMKHDDKKHHLNKFLSNNGLTVPFLLNLKRRGRPGVIDTDTLLKWLKLNKFKFSLAIYMAFYWPDTPESKEDDEYWNIMSFRWKRYLKQINYQE